MKHIKSYILLLAGIIFMFSGCTNLDEETFSDITEDTYEYSAGDATVLAGSAYATLRNYEGFYTYYVQEITTDETVQPANMAGWDDGGVFRRMHMHSWNTDQGHINDYWYWSYAGALLCNKAIGLISQDDFPFAPGETQEGMLAELRALRAYYYWVIMDNWGDAPLSTEKENITKAPRKDIYDFVVTELNESIDKLSSEVNTSTYGRFNKWAAKALLANVYLNAEVYTGTPQWQACIKQCDDIINSQKYRLEEDYLNPFKEHNENSVENIFVIPFDPIYAGGLEIYKAILHASNQATYKLQESPWGPGSYKAVPQFIDTYDLDDERLDMTWIQGPQYEYDGVTPVYGSYDMAGKPLVFVNSMPDGIYTGEADGFRLQKYEINVGGSTFMDNDFVIFRYAQVLMMKAECLLRTGDANGAATIVSQVRARAFKAHPEKAVVTGDQLKGNSSYVYGNVSNYVLTPQKEVLPAQFGRFYDELGWEFVGETMRRRDMIRFGTYTKARWLSHVPNGDYRAVFPIPQYAVDANPDLKQNPDYDQ